MPISSFPGFYPRDASIISPIPSPTQSAYHVIPLNTKQPQHPIQQRHKSRLHTSPLRTNPSPARPAQTSDHPPNPKPAPKPNLPRMKKKKKHDTKLKQDSLFASCRLTRTHPLSFNTNKNGRADPGAGRADVSTSVAEAASGAVIGSVPPRRGRGSAAGDGGVPILTITAIKSPRCPHLTLCLLWLVKVGRSADGTWLFVFNECDAACDRIR